jgi:hypothetical protein
MRAVLLWALQLAIHAILFFRSRHSAARRAANGLASSGREPPARWANPLSFADRSDAQAVRTSVLGERRFARRLSDSFGSSGDRHLAAIVDDLWQSGAGVRVPPVFWSRRFSIFLSSWQFGECTVGI